MLSVKTIFAPVDFSDRSIAAAEHAAQLARVFDAELSLVHVRPVESYVAAGAGAREEMAVREAQHSHGKLRAIADRLVPDGEVQLIDCQGDPAARLIHVINERQPDLVVMATHGAGAFRRFLLGSVTQKVLHDTQVPVLTGTHLEGGDRYSADCKRVLCAVGLKDRSHSEKVLKTAREWADALGAELHVAHAPAPTEVAAWEGVPVQSASSIEEERRGALAKLMTEIGTEAQAHVSAEDPVSFVSRTAKELDVNLVVTGRSVREGVLHWPHSDAFGIIRESPAPVLSL